MQFPVPQFTDVEDKIIGSLTVKQFGIMFAAGIIIFVAFSVTKSIIVGVFVGLLVGLPSLGLAFVKLNGRPLYNLIGSYVKFLSSPKVLVFHKQDNLLLPIGPEGAAMGFKQEETEKKPVAVTAAVAAVDTQKRIEEINKMVEQEEAKERELLNK